jgi:2-dehydro-3-deoxyphosphogluconate aldolase/(4S)-4-hydroxy-2-oxoglutarate aldolase
MAASEAGMRFIERLRVPVIPVIVLEDAADAVPLARVLADAGLTTLEITLRTPAALECIRRIAAEVPQVQVGAGTVTRVDEIERVLAAGARFALAPGLSETVLAEARACGLEYVPGVMTPSEVMRAVDAGCRWLKLFPAEQAGGVGMLRALASPFQGVRFCSTGGIDAARAPAYLAQPNVFAIGGSWMVPAAALRERQWSAVRELAQAAVATAAAARPPIG